MSPADILAEQTVLQWGHGWVAVEDVSIAAAAEVATLPLQWGHGWVAVEDGPSPIGG